MNCIFCGKPYKFSTDLSGSLKDSMRFYESNPDTCAIHSYLLPPYIDVYFIFFRCKSRSIYTNEYISEKKIKNLDSLISLINMGVFLKI